MIMCMCKRLFTTTYYLQLLTKSTTYNYLGTVTLHNLFPLYTFDNIGACLWKVRIGEGGFLNVPYDIYMYIFLTWSFCAGCKTSTIGLFELCINRAVAAYLKEVWRMKPFSAEGTWGGEQERGIFPLLSEGFWDSPPIFFFFEFWAHLCAFKCVFMRLGPNFSRFGHDFLPEKIFLGVW